MLQLVEKMKTKQKEIGWFVFSYFWIWIDILFSAKYQDSWA
jgi:hypothetical protein